MNLLPPFAHCQVTHRPHIEPVQGEHQKHLRSPSTNAPKSGEFGNHLMVVLVFRGGREIQFARVHGERQLGDGAHLCPG